MAAGFFQCWPGTLPGFGDTLSLRRNQSINFVVVQVLIEWPCQN